LTIRGRQRGGNVSVDFLTPARFSVNGSIVRRQTNIFQRSKLFNVRLLEVAHNSCVDTSAFNGFIFNDVVWLITESRKLILLKPLVDKRRRSERIGHI
jgi:hypothetical protein